MKWDKIRIWFFAVWIISIYLFCALGTATLGLICISFFFSNFSAFIDYGFDVSTFILISLMYSMFVFGTKLVWKIPDVVETIILSAKKQVG